MQIPLEIIYRNVQKTETIERLIRQRSAKLEKLCSYIISCRIAVEKPQAHHQTGRPYRVRLDIRMPPRQEIIIKREPSNASKELASLPVIINNIFKAAEHKLTKITKK